MGWLSSAFTSNLGIVEECKTSRVEINIWVIVKYGRTGRFPASKRRNYVAVKLFSGSMYLWNSNEVLIPDGWQYIHMLKLLMGIKLYTKRKVYQVNCGIKSKKRGNSNFY